MADTERISEALGDEEAVFVTADVLNKVTANSELGISEQLASGELTEEKLGIMAAIIVTHEIGRWYGLGTRAIAEAATKINKLRNPPEETL